MNTGTPRTDAAIITPKQWDYVSADVCRQLEREILHLHFLIRETKSVLEMIAEHTVLERDGLTGGTVFRVSEYGLSLEQAQQVVDALGRIAEGPLKHTGFANSEHLQPSDATLSQPTPRTDALLAKYDEHHYPPHKELIAFARQLERELAALHSERENWRVSSVCRELAAELAESRARIIELEAALADAMQYVPEATRTAIECERVIAAAKEESK